MITNGGAGVEPEQELVKHQGSVGLKQPGAASSLQRFQPSRSILLVDRFMTHFIKVGGVLIIAAVLGIFVFIAWQIFPLFQQARVKEIKSLDIPKKEYAVIGLDEWSQYPFLIDSKGKISFADLTGKRGVEEIDPGFTEAKQISAVQYNPERQMIVMGTADGSFSIVRIDYSSSVENQERIVIQQTQASPFYTIGKPGNPIREIGYGDDGNLKLVAAIQEVDGNLEVHGVSLTQSRTLFGAGEIAVDQAFDLTGSITGRPEKIAVNPKSSGVLVSNDQGSVFNFAFRGTELQFIQEFKPFDSGRNSLMEFLLGGSSIIFVDDRGTNRIFSSYTPKGGDLRIFNPIHELTPLPGPASSYDFSLRNKAFLITSGNFASLRYATTENIRWEARLPFEIKDAALGGKYNSMVFLGADGRLHMYQIEDPHPESNFKSLFGKIWYEGATEPKYEWQSTGATDDFEQKLSIVPLIIGSLKGTFYAMLFAVPIALLAAIYTSQFLHPNFRIFVKPTMEIMASLPSVVLGFLAALWLAPLLETRVPSVIILIILLPLSALLFGFVWNTLPIHMRIKVKPGFEWLMYFPVLLIVAYFSWIAGPEIEKALFIVMDPQTGMPVADFRLWWPQVTGLPFEQRNSLVVGFIMGFAVIPIIFTIAEDALSNVPGALRSGSLALGASRWQTAMRIVLPTASAGIFSAIMIGLGRAVGETMIVVMATGNTPILDFNIFSGMRTLSANIAVELPEAPHHSTLYRTLFLGGMVLFLMTFFVNTLAEILRQHLREKYKTI